MLKPDELKERLTEIIDEQSDAGTGTDIQDIVPDMLRHIGSLNSDLRELIYDTFHNGTVKGWFTAEQMRQVLDVCLDGEHLFFGIGGENADSVFTRTFSLLLIPLALYLDRMEPFLSEKEVTDIREKTIRYLRQEKDVRGFVPGKGWAHSTAHGADALDDIAKSKYTGHDALLELLDAIKDKICIDYYTYINKEDDRMAVAALSVFERGLLKKDEIINWIKSFGSAEKTREYPGDLHRIMNARNFLRSLYFKLYGQADAKNYTDAAMETLKHL